LDPARNPDSDAYHRKTYSKIPDAFGATVEVNRSHLVDAKTGRWYQIKKLGSGRMVFAGLTPDQASSQHLIKELLLGLSHVKVSVNSVQADGCHSALLAEPYGASPEALRSFANHLQSAHIPLQWALSAESFARMAPEWKAHFTANNIVFIDDGKAETRNFASEIYQFFFKVTHPPVFVTYSDQKPSLAGPETLLLRVELMPSGEAKESSTALWESSCLSGVARPRLLTSNEMKNNLSFWQNSLTSLANFRMQNANELLDNASRLDSTAKRTLVGSDNDPMKYETEKSSP
jgi:hypothetical protein